MKQKSIMCVPPVLWAGSLLVQALTTQSAEIRNGNATACIVRSGARTAELSLKAGEAIQLNADLGVIN